MLVMISHFAKSTKNDGSIEFFSIQPLLEPSLECKCTALNRMSLKGTVASTRALPVVCFHNPEATSDYQISSRKKHYPPVFPSCSST